MAFSYNGTSTVVGGSVTIYPDGISSSITFNVTEQPFNLPFVAGNCPLSIVGTPSYSFTVSTGNQETYKYDTSFSYNPTTFEVSIVLTKDPSNIFSFEPAVAPVGIIGTLGFTFLYSGI
jgi:hypothetical protein